MKNKMSLQSKIQKQKYKIILLFPVYCLLSTVFCLLSTAPAAQAQQAPIFSTHFSAKVGTTIIPPCLTQASTPTNPCIANQSQTAGAVSFNWNLLSPSALAYFFIEGSNNTATEILSNTATWFILAQNQQGAVGSFSTIIGNGDGFQNNFSHTLFHPVVPGSISIPLGGGTDDGVTPVGSITGPGIASGTIVYATGVINIHYSPPVPGIGVPVVVNYNVVASAAGTPGGIIYYNGAYGHIRIYIVVPSGGASTLTADYTALPQPLPLNFTADVNVNAASVGNPVQIGKLSAANVNVVEGVQCYNPNNSVAYLQFLKSTTGSPTLGSSPFFEIPIAANSDWVYPGVSIQIWNMIPNPGDLGTFWLGASTASLGNTAVNSPLECNVQMNTTGPFYPLTPVGP